MLYQFADCRLDTDARTLIRDGTDVPIEPQVFDLLWLLLENTGRVVTKDEIIDHVWGGRIVSESAISARIAATRKAVGDDGKRQAVIRTVARRGLQLVAEVTPQTEQTPPGPSSRPHIRYTRTETGQNLAYALNGDGPPLLRVGFFATNLETEWSIPAMRTQFERFGSQHRLARYDEIGCGLSDRDMTTTDLAEKADSVRAVADAAGFDRFALLSESGGCFAALHFAARYPDRVERLVLTGGYVDGRSLRANAQQPDPVRALIAAGWGSKEIGLGRAFLLAYGPDGPYEVISAMVDMMQDAVSRDVMLRQRDLVNTASVASLLPQIRCPTLIVHGRNDGIHPLSEAQKMAAGIPDARLVALDTANHLPILGHPTFDQYLDTVMAFLAGEPTG